MSTANPEQLELAPTELPTLELPWLDNLRRGIWPKPMVFWAVVFYIGLFIIRPWEKLIPELGEFRFELLAVAAVSLFVAFKRGPMVKFSAQNITMLLLFAAVFISGRNAWDPSLAEEEVVEFFGFALIFFFIQKAVKTPYQALFIIASYLMLTTVYVGKSIWEYAFHGAANYMMGVYRLAGIDHTYGHPNTMGTSMLLSLPFAIYFYRVRDQFCRTWPGRLRRLFPWVLRFHIAASVLGVMLTRSRSAAVALVFFAMIIVMRQRGFARKAKYGVLACLVLIIGFFLSPSDIRQRMATLWNKDANQFGSQKSAEGRWEGFVAGVDIFKEFPSTGVGIGNFADYRELHGDGEKLNAHNLPGELLGELGLFGTTAFAAFFLVHVLTLRKMKRAGGEFESLTGNKLYSWLYIALCDALLLMLFSSLSGHTLQQYQWYFFAAFAVVSLQYVRKELGVARQVVAENLAYEEELPEYEPVATVGFDGFDPTPYQSPQT